MNISGKVSFISVSISIVWLLSCISCTEKVTMTSLIEEMTSRADLSYFPQKPFTHRQFSSHNPESVSPDREGWFANNDMSHFIRVEMNSGRREFVMFDADGPGAIVRWWMTFYKAQYGLIRIYIDNDTIPVVKGAPDLLLSGPLLTDSPLAVSVQAGAPLGEEGRDYDHNLYVPIPFARHCKITYECDSIELRYEYEGIHVEKGYYWPDVFYNIGYRAYAKNINVESVTTRTVKEAKPLLDNAGKLLLNDKITCTTEKIFDKIISPGDSLVMEFRGEMQAITKLVANLETSGMQQALRSSVFQASFDGYRTIWVPVGEFFGSGYSLNYHRTWMNQRDVNGTMESFWVMPFREKCVLTVINYGAENIHLKVVVGLDSYKWNNNSMYFGSSWHEYFHLKSRNEKGLPFDLNFIDIKGRGIYAGDQITLFNNTYQWWGEGDEKIFVDGESFPSSFGTGSEDYYGYSFGRQEPFSHPFLSQPVGIGNMSWGVTTDMRHRSLDAIPFTKSISSNIELWHWADIRMNYALTTFYYLMPPFKHNIIPDIESVRRPVALSKIDFNLDEK